MTAAARQILVLFLFISVVGCAEPPLAERTGGDAQDGAPTTAPAAENLQRPTAETSQQAAEQQPAVAIEAAAPGALLRIPAATEQMAVGSAAQFSLADETGRPPCSRLPAPDSEQFPGLRRMSEEYDVWLDTANKQVVMQAGVCMREGPLELFACIHRWVEDELKRGVKIRRGTKEYESLLTTNTTAALVHTALLLTGAQNGNPVRFEPEYQAAHGTEIEIQLHWTDAAGNRQQARAQDWVRNTSTGEAMEQPWVFAGSGFWVDQDAGVSHYMGEAGDLICVSNFTTAVLDLPINSPQDNRHLLFEAFTERVPPVGTTVTMVLKPKHALAQAEPPADTEDDARRTE